MQNRKNLICIPFHAHLDDGCDYVEQTVGILAKTNIVVGITLGNPINWFSFIMNHKQLIEHKWNAILVHPLSFIPGQRFQRVKIINYWINAVIIKLVITMKYPQYNKLLWIFEPLYAPIFLNIFSTWESLYDCVDYFSARGLSWKRDERYVLARCDRVVVNSLTLFNLHKNVRSDIHVVPLGFANQLFPTRKKIYSNKHQQRSLVIGFIGSLSYRLDYLLLQKVIANFPHDTFVFVGPILFGVGKDESQLQANIQALLRLPNVQHINYVSKASVVDIIRKFDIGIIPYDLHNDFNRFCFPMKIMEYFSQGLPVVSTSILELVSFSKLLILANSVSEYCDAINRVRMGKFIVNPDTLNKIAQSHSWKNKIDEIMKVLLEKTIRGDERA
jgi:glycosyltransferase involved in cell wall biosynthesis